MLDIIIDTLLDALKLIPFLFLAFLLMEYLEHKIDNKKIVNTKYGPLLGGILGAVPQCGFSAAATNFYAMRIISVGTLISIYLSTSDEMLPIMLSGGVDAVTILKIIGFKALIGIIFGFIIDFIFRKKENVDIKDFCEEEHCHCEHGIFKSTLKHTFNIIIFIMIISFILNIGFEYLGEDNISKLFLKGSIFSPFLASLIGLIPNCGASVIITELYLNDVITFGSCMAGLLTGSGVALLILFRVNKNLKENVEILLSVYGIGVLVGIIIDIIKLTI